MNTASKQDLESESSRHRLIGQEASLDHATKKEHTIIHEDEEGDGAENGKKKKRRFRKKRSQAPSGPVVPYLSFLDS